MATTGLPAWPWAATPACDLPAPERLLLDAARLWYLARRRGASPALAVRAPFVAEDAPAAALPFAELLHTIAAGAAPGFGCPLCERATPDEARLLLACALTQRGARPEALSGFLRWLPPLAAYACMPSAMALAAALRGAGLLLEHPFRLSRAAPPG